jgi:hypothetical protein
MFSLHAEWQALVKPSRIQRRSAAWTWQMMRSPICRRRRRCRSGAAAGRPCT